MNDYQQALAAARRIIECERAGDGLWMPAFAVRVFIDATIVSRTFLRNHAISHGERITVTLTGEHGRPMPQGTRESGPE